MFSFIAPLLVVLSLAGIVVIILRKTPEVRRVSDKVLPKNINSLADFFDVSSERIKSSFKLFWQGLKWLGSKLWSFILGAKDLSQKSGITSLPGKITKTAIETTKINLKKVSKGSLKETREPQKTENEEDEYLEAIKKNPKDQDAYLGLGKLYLSQEKFEDAKDTFVFLTKKYPDNELYHFNLGKVYMGLRKFKEAVLSYRAAVTIKPNDGGQYINLGFALDAAGDGDNAIDSFLKAVAIDEDNIYFLSTLADAYEKRGLKEEAAEILEKILVHEPTNEKVRERLMKIKF